jgi:hypothetical protein
VEYVFTSGIDDHSHPHLNANTCSKLRKVLTMEKPIRFTISLPVETHTAFKVKCAQARVQMTDVVRDLIERDLAAQSKPKAGKPVKSAARELAPA